MKTIEIEKTIKEQWYEAIDGTQFRSKEECVKYEESAKCVLLNRYNKLVINNDLSDENLYQVGSDENDIHLVKVNSEEDIKVLMQLFYLYNFNSSQKYVSEIENSCYRALREDDFIIVYRGYYNEDNFWIRGTRNELIEHINNVCNESSSN